MEEKMYRFYGKDAYVNGSLIPFSEVPEKDAARWTTAKNAGAAYHAIKEKFAKIAFVTEDGDKVFPYASDTFRCYPINMGEVTINGKQETTNQSQTDTVEINNGTAAENKAESATSVAEAKEEEKMNENVAFVMAVAKEKGFIISQAFAAWIVKNQTWKQMGFMMATDSADPEKDNRQFISNCLVKSIIQNLEKGQPAKGILMVSDVSLQDIVDLIDEKILQPQKTIYVSDTANFFMQLTNSKTKLEEVWGTRVVLDFVDKAIDIIDLGDGHHQVEYIEVTPWKKPTTNAINPVSAPVNKAEEKEEEVTMEENKSLYVGIDMSDKKAVRKISNQLLSQIIDKRVNEEKHLFSKVFNILYDSDIYADISVDKPDTHILVFYNKKDVELYDMEGVLLPIESAVKFARAAWVEMPNLVDEKNAAACRARIQALFPPKKKEEPKTEPVVNKPVAAAENKTASAPIAQKKEETMEKENKVYLNSMEQASAEDSWEYLSSLVMSKNPGGEIKLTTVENGKKQQLACYVEYWKNKENEKLYHGKVFQDGKQIGLFFWPIAESYYPYYKPEPGLLGQPNDNKKHKYITFVSKKSWSKVVPADRENRININGFILAIKGLLGKKGIHSEWVPSTDNQYKGRETGIAYSNTGDMPDYYAAAAATAVPQKCREEEFWG